MATKIVTKNSSTASAVPTASDLVQGELAVNVADKRLFTEDNAGAIVELGVNPATEITANAGIALPDSQKATFGASDDLQIYHDGTHSTIADEGTGQLKLTTNGTNIQLNKGTSENMLVCTVDGSVDLYYDSNPKLATTATGIDVTGTATMDGLTVDGNATFSGSVTTENHFAVIPPTTTNYAYMDYSNAGGSMYVGRERSSASGLLTGSTAYAGVINVTGAYPLEFGTNNSKRMTIDSSGNLLVGKSATAFGTAGVEASASSGLWSTRSGFPPLALNRLSTDGSIADFYKDGTTVGSIGTPFTGELYIAASGANSSGLLLTESNAVRPMKNGSASDATQDLGRINGRWKDLYLSGGVYLGGTGAANKLDDYEEGTWTPVVTSSGGTITSVTSQIGTYTKIGRLVTLQYQFNIATLGTASGNCIVSGMPFTEDNSEISYYAGVHRARSGAASTTEFDVGGTLQLYGTTPVAGVYLGSMVYNTTA